MGVLRPLSERVGEGGRVLGIDADESFVKSAERFISDNELENVRVRQADIFGDGLPDEMFDLVHLRFMFAPYGRDDELLTRALALLRPGGVLLVQEPDASCWNTMPPHPAFEELKSLIHDGFRRAGGDFNAGQRIFRRLRRSGLHRVATRACVHAWLANLGALAVTVIFWYTNPKTPLAFAAIRFGYMLSKTTFVILLAAGMRRVGRRAMLMIVAGCAVGAVLIPTLDWLGFVMSVVIGAAHGSGAIILLVDRRPGLGWLAARFFVRTRLITSAAGAHGARILPHPG